MIPRETKRSAWKSDRSGTRPWRLYVHRAKQGPPVIKGDSGDRILKNMGTSHRNGVHEEWK
jgi:hypothetical protein